MNKFPDTLLKYRAQVVFFLALPIFFFVWVLLYDSGSMVALLKCGRPDSALNLNLPVVSSIILVTAVLTRTLLYLLRNHLSMTTFKYVMWCVAEVALMAVFSAIYLGLMDRSGQVYFDILINALWHFYSILVYPYIIITLMYYLVAAEEPREVDESTRIRFYDSRHMLKFITTVSSILYVESKENYVTIHYVENGIIKQYQLRNTMKSIEELLSRSGFARTHRSFCVNPSHITLLRREKNGLFFAELDSGAKESIPVSKKYYEVVTSLL